MTMHIYKGIDGKYHIMGNITQGMKCGLTYIPENILESRKVGIQGNTALPEPPKSEWCSICDPIYSIRK